MRQPGCILDNAMTLSASGNLAITAAALRKDYADRAVLRGVDLSIGWGEVVALFGANGVGKTTLLRILAGLARPDAGSVHIAGRRLDHRGESARRLVGFVGHQTMLYNDLTCRENLQFYARLYGLNSPQHRIGTTLDRVGLLNRADRRVRTLSHGMQKRLSVARAILHEPAILLMDEPESGLDAASVATLGALLQDWVESGKTVLLTTHNERIGLDWSNRVVALAAGRVAFDSPTNATTAAAIRAAMTPVSLPR